MRAPSPPWLALVCGLACACGDVPTLTFPSRDAGPDGSEAAAPNADAGGDAAAGGCPGANPPPGAYICCGAIACEGLCSGQCDLCASKCTSPGQICCAKNNNVLCVAAGSICH